MNVSFEAKLNELQADMISICMEYCENHCEKTFVHIIYEKGVLFVDFFFRVDGEMRRKSHLDGGGEAVDARRQQKALSIIMEDAREIFDLFTEKRQQVPTELRLVFDNESKNFNVDYSYDKITNDDLSDREVSDNWFRQLQK